MLAKFTAPSKIDIAPYKTIWQFIHSDKSYDYYIQMSETETMRWERLGSVLERAFEYHIINDTSFIEDALRLIAVRVIEIEKPEA